MASAHAYRQGPTFPALLVAKRIVAHADEPGFAARQLCHGAHRAPLNAHVFQAFVHQPAPIDGERKPIRVYAFVQSPRLRNQIGDRAVDSEDATLSDKRHGDADGAAHDAIGSARMVRLKGKPDINPLFNQGVAEAPDSVG